MEKLKVSQAIIVEGKYDKIKLSAVVDAVIICTNGYGIYKDKNTAELIRTYARTSGIIILTDSDFAGFQIRNHIKGLVPDGKVINLYTPEIFGKEKRKSVPSKEGKLGVEGIDVGVLRQVFESSGVLVSQEQNKEIVTRNDFYRLGISGRPYSSELRKRLCKELGLPCCLTSKALVEHINAVGDKQELIEIVKKLKNDMT